LQSGEKTSSRCDLLHPSAASFLCATLASALALFDR
jgi:hypothetical protein